MKGTFSLRAAQLGINLSYMPREFSSIWKTAPPGWKEALDETCAKIQQAALPPIFFRADDIGAAGQTFDFLSKLFRHYQVPLAMAVVPAWLSDARQERLFRAAPIDEDLWSWHQHGWRHINWQKSGKKGEFGSDRPAERQLEDLSQGFQKMERVFGDYFTPIFTPPWNHLSTATVKALRKLNFRGVSIANAATPRVKLPCEFTNFPTHLDLHAKKENDPRLDLGRLLDRLCRLADRDGPCGIVVHHQRMTPFAFEFLDHMLYNLQNVLKAQFCSLKEIVNSSNEKQACARLR